METKTFKIRLGFWKGDDDEYTYLDELPEDRRDARISWLRCEYNWIDYPENWHRLDYGFTSHDVEMDAVYKDGCINVTLAAADSFDRPVACIKGYQSKCIVVRRLMDWVKDCINGQLSDGIGENEVGEYIDDFGIKRELWLADLVTDEPTNHGSFIIDKAIDVIKGKEAARIIEECHMPEYAEKADGMHEECSRLLAKYKESRKDEDHDAWRKVHDEYTEFEDMDTDWMIEQLDARFGNHGGEVKTNQE